MSRYIDVEKFKQLLYDKGYVVNKYGDVNTSITTINCCIESAKVDAVEVVRCKDCEHCAEVFQSMIFGEIIGCARWHEAVLPHNYCSYGKRRTSDKK